MSRVTSRSTPDARRGGPMAPRLAGAVLAACLLGSCGGDDAPRVDEGTEPAEGGAQPSAEAATFVDDLDVPVPAGAEPVSAPEIGEGFEAQSYRLPGRTPEQVLDHFAEELEADGWEVAEAPAPVGETDWQGEWLTGSRILEVSATPWRAGDDAHDARVSQFSLVVRDG